MEISGLGKLLQKQQVGGGGRMGYERQQSRPLKQVTWQGHFPSELGSWYSSFRVLKILKSLLETTNTYDPFN